MIDEPEVVCVRVEGPPPGDTVVDKVDFDVVDADGAVCEAVQVKSRVAGGYMSGTMALASCWTCSAAVRGRAVTAQPAWYRHTERPPAGAT